MRLIDADALLEAIKNKYGANGGGIIDLITNAPTVQREASIADFLSEEEKDGLKFQKNKHAPIAPVQREGWVSVPIDPTEEMINKCLVHCYSSDDVIQSYQAMIQAAPKE